MLKNVFYGRKTKIREIKDTQSSFGIKLQKFPSLETYQIGSCYYAMDAHFQKICKTLLSFGEKVLGYHPSNLTEFSW